MLPLPTDYEQFYEPTRGTWKSLMEGGHIAAFRQYLSHIIFSFAKMTDFIPQTCARMGDTTKAQKLSTKHSCFVFVINSFSRYKDKDCTKDGMGHSFDSFQFYRRKRLNPRCFSPVACTPRMVSKHITADWHECEVTWIYK